MPLVRPLLKALSRLATQSVEAGAEPLVRAIDDPEATGGQYWGPSGRNQYRGPARPLPIPTPALDEAAAWRLWAQSIELSGVSYLAD